MRSSVKRGHSLQAKILAGVAAILLCGSASAGCAASHDGSALPVPASTPSEAKTPSHQVPAVAPLPASEPIRIQIPAIEVDSALIDLGLQADGTMEVPADGTVAGWYTKAPTPGELGPAVIAAHVDWNGEPGVFYHLKDLSPGDEVSVQRDDGTTALFQITKVEQYPKAEFPTEVVYGNIDHAGLRLITCGGAFDDDARSYEDNIIVYARLIGAR